LPSKERTHDAGTGHVTGNGRSAGGILCFLNLGKIMEWLSQNWIWLAFAAVLIFMMRRGGGCCGGGHGAEDKRPDAKGTQTENGSAGHRH
jgi:hypothetical protein